MDSCGTENNGSNNWVANRSFPFERKDPKGGFPVMAETTRKLAASTR